MTQGPSPTASTWDRGQHPARRPLGPSCGWARGVGTPSDRTGGPCCRWGTPFSPGVRLVSDCVQRGCKWGTVLRWGGCQWHPHVPGSTGTTLPGTGAGGASGPFAPLPLMCRDLGRGQNASKKRPQVRSGLPPVRGHRACHCLREKLPLHSTVRVSSGTGWARAPLGSLRSGRPGLLKP